MIIEAGSIIIIISIIVQSKHTGARKMKEHAHAPTASNGQAT